MGENEISTVRPLERLGDFSSVRPRSAIKLTVSPGPRFLYSNLKKGEL